MQDAAQTAHQQNAALGLIGKHPAYGDFLRAGVSPDLAEIIEGWLATTLTDLRDDLGNDWAAFWDQGQDLRFWIGRAIWGRSVIGVLRPSRDRSGRRYPLLLLFEAADLPPPTVAPEQDLWDQMTAHLDAMQPGQGAQALLAGADLSCPAETAAKAAEGLTLWAHHPEGDLAALLASAQKVDQARASLGRSYWWAPGGAGRAAIWYGTQGMISAQALGWCLAGQPGTSQAMAGEGAADE